MVYFILDQDTKMIKIGHSDSPYKRLRQLQLGFRERLNYSLELVLPGGQRFEKDFHDKYKEFHKHGEWFFPNLLIENFIAEARKEDVDFCPVCGEMYLTTPEEKDVSKHSNYHIILRKGAYPYETREILKRIAWQYIGDKDKPVSVSSFIKNDNDAKRLIAFSKWMREKQFNPNFPDNYFDDFVLDQIDYIDAKESGNADDLRKVDEKLKRHWKTGKYQTYN